MKLAKDLNKLAAELAAMPEIGLTGTCVSVPTKRRAAMVKTMRIAANMMKTHT